MTYPTLPPTAGDEILSIELAPPGCRARPVVRRSNCRPTGKFPSVKAGRMIHWESSNELNAYRLLECNAAVRTYREQPCVIRFILNGTEHRHYPDCLVITAAAKALWEIKTTDDAARPEIRERTRFLAQALPKFGYQYQVVLAEDLARQPRLQNVCTLLRHGRRPLSFEQREFARQLFASVSRVRWTEVVSGAHAPFVLQHACRLVLEGVLNLHLEAKLDEHALVMRAPEGAWNGGSNG